MLNIIQRIVRDQRAKKAAVAPVVQAELVLGSGSFQLTPFGIMMILNPPLDRLSGLCDWSALPSSLAALKMLTLGDPEPSLEKLALTELECDALDQRIGRIDWHIGGSGKLELIHQSELCSDIDRLLRWGAKHRGMCKDDSIRRVLGEIPFMGPEELIEHVNPQTR